MKLLIQHGNLIDPVLNEERVMDILIENGQIAAISAHLEDPEAQVLDASGMAVSAGLIDMHVHFRDPGFTEKEDIITGSRAAAHGGFTTVTCMPNTRPTVDSPEMVKYVYDRAKEGSGVHVLPIAAVSMGEKGAVLTDAKALKQAGAVALSDDGVPVQSANLMRDALICASRQQLAVLTHCEDADMVKNYAVNEGRISRQLGIPGRPAIAEEIMVMRDAMLAEETQTAVHICHISTGRAVDIVRKYKKKGVKITCETCPQYFTLNQREILEQGAMARVNPPLRTSRDVAAVLAGVKDGTIDCIVTDHAPHTAEEKARGLEKAPSGMVGLETSLGITLTQLYHTGEMTLPEIIAKMTVNPARILNLDCGRLSAGSAADLTIFDPNEEWVVDAEKFASKGRNTPFNGRTLKGKVKYTIVGGKIIYQDGGEN
ncbi:MAG: dihydroorotase [Oscillospiraceae bacterium]|nr:dihydroorotase [Oscillospiraceae bacterium]